MESGNAADISVTPLAPLNWRAIIRSRTTGWLGLIAG
jgi:hypothetical protein